MELNRLLLKIVLLCQADIQKSSRKGNAKFNFLGMIWESIFLEGAFFRLSKSLKSKILATSVPTACYIGGYYKPPVLSYSEVGMYGPHKSCLTFE